MDIMSNNSITTIYYVVSFDHVDWFVLFILLKRAIAYVCVSFLAKYIPIIDNFVIGGGHFDFLYNHWFK